MADSNLILLRYAHLTISAITKLEAFVYVKCRNHKADLKKSAFLFDRNTTFVVFNTTNVVNGVIYERKSIHRSA